MLKLTFLYSAQKGLLYLPSFLRVRYLCQNMRASMIYCKCFYLWFGGKECKRSYLAIWTRYKTIYGIEQWELTRDSMANKRYCVPEITGGTQYIYALECICINNASVSVVMLQL